MGVWPSLVYGACLENKWRLIPVRGFKSYRSRQKPLRVRFREIVEERICLRLMGVMTLAQETRRCPRQSLEKLVGGMEVT